jgi:3-hydroxyisobutyrate dehydrogenase-like beta-hydroxyacid dehydrogenase
MTFSCIGILSPGEMGAAIGGSLASKGFSVLAALNGRSERTRGLASQNGIVNVGSIDQLVRQCDVILSILAPAAAAVAAQQVGAAMQATATRPLFVDCNSIAPQTSRKVGDFIAAAGGKFLDAALVGRPPGGANVVRLYASGQEAQLLEALGTDHIQVHILGAEAGAASALRICYNAFGEGLTAIATQLLVAAERFGIDKALRSELLETRGTAYEWVMRSIPELVPRTQRAVKEMEEAALAFESVGLTPKPLLGIADVLRWIADAMASRPAAEPGLPESAREVVARLGRS